MALQPGIENLVSRVELAEIMGGGEALKAQL
jgi:hypothetical protein